jgi:aldose 1-epimerase
MISEQPFGIKDNQQVIEYTIRNATGMFVSILNYGATISKILVPDRLRDLGDVVLGFDNLDGYTQKDNPYFGSLVGRYANRIAKGRFSLDGKTYSLAINNDGNALHGGLVGFDKKIWQVADAKEKQSIQFIYHSPDGEEGYPGNLHVEVTYSLNDGNELEIKYDATTDQATPVNLTNHSYFNLGGSSSDNILDHQVVIYANKYTVKDSTSIPTGELAEVKGTPFDFNEPKLAGKDIASVSGGGYDHNYVLRKSGDELSLGATVYHPQSGRFMEMLTTEPGMQFYTSNFLDGKLKGKDRKAYGKYAALCLEAQHFPDSPNQPLFPNTILRPGEKYHQTTIYRFSIK